MVQLSMMGPLIAEGPALRFSRLGPQIDFLLKKKRWSVPAQHPPREFPLHSCAQRQGFLYFSILPKTVSDSSILMIFKVRNYFMSYKALCLHLKFVVSIKNLNLIININIINISRHFSKGWTVTRVGGGDTIKKNQHFLVFLSNTVG